MALKTLTSLCAVASLLAIAAQAPAANARYATEAASGTQTRAVAQSPEQNIRESEQYTRLVQTNPRFRTQRMQLECGPIDDPDLHAQCVDSFGQGSTSGQ